MIFQLHAKQLFQFISIHQFARTLCFQRNSVELLIYRSLKMQAWLQLDCISECWLIKTCLGLKYPATTFFEDSGMASPSETLQADLLTRTLSPTEESQELAENSSMPVDPESAYRYPDIDTWCIELSLVNTTHFERFAPLQTTIFRHNVTTKIKRSTLGPALFLFLLPG